MTQIFLRFTVKGDSLDVQKMAVSIPLPADIFIKGEPVIYKFKVKKPKIQETNRWVLSLESSEGENVNTMLARLDRLIRPYKREIIYYTKKYSSDIDVVIYINTEKTISKFNAVLTKKSLKLLNELNVKFSLTVFDW